VELELAICWTGIITSVMYYFWNMQRLFLDGEKRSPVYRTKHSTKSKLASTPVQESKRSPLYPAAQESPLCVSGLDGIEQSGTRALSMELSDQLANDVGVRDFANDTYGSQRHFCDGSQRHRTPKNLQHQSSEASLRNLAMLEFQLDKLICQHDLEKNQAPLFELSSSSGKTGSSYNLSLNSGSLNSGSFSELAEKTCQHLKISKFDLWRNKPLWNSLKKMELAQATWESTKPPQPCASSDLQAKDPTAKDPRFGKRKISSAIFIEPDSGSSGSSSTFSDIPRAEDASVSKPDAKIHNLKAQVTNHLLSRTSGPGSQPGVVVVWPQVGTLEPCGKAKYVVESKPPQSCASADLQAKNPSARFGKHKVSSAIMIEPNSGSSSTFSEKLRAEDARESEPVAKMHKFKAQVTNHLLSRMSDPGSQPGVVVVCGRRRKCPHTQQQRLGPGRSSLD
jgi:hypothetical protein